MEASWQRGKRRQKSEEVVAQLRRGASSDSRRAFRPAYAKRSDAAMATTGISHCRFWMAMTVTAMTATVTTAQPKAPAARPQAVARVARRRRLRRLAAREGEASSRSEMK